MGHQWVPNPGEGRGEEEGGRGGKERRGGEEWEREGRGGESRKGRGGDGGEEGEGEEGRGEEGKARGGEKRGGEDVKERKNTRKAPAFPSTSGDRRRPGGRGTGTLRAAPPGPSLCTYPPHSRVWL